MADDSGNSTLSSSSTSWELPSKADDMIEMLEPKEEASEKPKEEDEPATKPVSWHLLFYTCIHIKYCIIIYIYVIYVCFRVLLLK